MSIYHFVIFVKPVEERNSGLKGYCKASERGTLWASEARLHTKEKKMYANKKEINRNQLFYLLNLLH